MSKTKSPKQRALENVRPIPDSSFTLQAMPGRTFRFRTPDVDDESWTKKMFGKNLGKLLRDGEEINTDHLAQIWFHHLPLEDQKRFPPVECEKMDLESGEITKERIPPWRVLQRAVKSGIESIIVMTAFRNALIAGRPFEDLSDEIKKKVEAQLAREKAKTAAQTSTI